jgi:ubiquinone/menaquinone biosynthesis C-methylase UbiE
MEEQNFKSFAETYLRLIDKERNIYELAELYKQNRKAVSEYIDLLQDPNSGAQLELGNQKLSGDREYDIIDNVPVFINASKKSEEWERLNKQFLNYHKSLSPYTLLNAAPIVNYLSIKSGFGLLKNQRVLDVGGGTGHTFASFFQFPETIEYFLLDPNLRLLHDQFIRLYPKLAFLKMAHIQAHAELLPFKENSFDVVLNLSAIDHLDDYEKFIDEAFRVLKSGGKVLISSHLDISVGSENRTSRFAKIFSSSLWERIARFIYFRKYAVGKDDHTLHLESENPVEVAMRKSGFQIEIKEVFKRYFFIVGVKSI